MLTGGLKAIVMENKTNPQRQKTAIVNKLDFFIESGSIAQKKLFDYIGNSTLTITCRALDDRTLYIMRLTLSHTSTHLFHTHHCFIG